MAEINKDDLMLMMDIYKESIATSTALSRQQNVTIEHQKDLITEQRSINNNISKLIDRLDDHSISLTQMQSKVIEKVGSNNELCAKEFGSVKNQMYIAYVGMGTIIIAILGLIFKLI